MKKAGPMAHTSNRKRAIDGEAFLDPKVARAAAAVHLRANNDRGHCGIVGTWDDPQLTEDLRLVTCRRCRVIAQKDAMK